MSKASANGYEPVSREQPVLGFLRLLVTLLVIVTVLDHQETFRNGFHAQLTRAWRFVWEDVASKSEWTMFVILTNAWGTLVYWGAALPYSVLDFCNFESSRKYKVQPETNEPVDSRKYWSCVRQVAFNQVVVGPLMAMAAFPLLQKRGIDFSHEAIPGLSTFLRHLALYLVVEEIGFYYSHRMFHEVKPLYRAIHKQHHEWQASISIAARYAHPVEDVLANVSPIMMGPLLMNSPMVFWWIWLTIALMSTVNSHSGYHFPFFPSGEGHDFHHLKFDCNYGAMGILDALHNTDARFRESVEVHRHHVLNSFQSARETVPDVVAKKKVEVKKEI